jgi:hypothetical protein
MDFKKRGLGRGLEALLADFSTKDDDAPHYQKDLIFTRQSNGISNVFDAERSKFQKIAEQSRSRIAQFQELKVVPAARTDPGALSSVARILIEDLQRDNLVLLEEAEALLQLFDEFLAIVNSQ